MKVMMTTQNHWRIDTTNAIILYIFNPAPWLFCDFLSLKKIYLQTYLAETYECDQILK